MRGQADADGVAAGGESGGQAAARGQHERERAGPVAFDQGLGRVVAGRAYYCAYLLCVTQQDGQRLMVWALLDRKQLVDGDGIAIKANKAVDGIGGDADDPPCCTAAAACSSAPVWSAAITTVIGSAPLQIKSRCAGFCEAGLFAPLQKAAQFFLYCALCILYSALCILLMA